MTNINCSNNCIYQHDGKCFFDSTSKVLLTPDRKCAYFCKKNVEELKIL